MKNPLHPPRSRSSFEATLQAIKLLEEAKTVMREVVHLRMQEKMSYTRASNVGREINEIIKVLSLYIPQEA